LKSTIPASSGGQGVYVKFFGFPWPPIKAAFKLLSLVFCYKAICRVEIKKPKEIPLLPNHKLSKTISKRTVW